MEDEKIIQLYFNRSDRAIDETAMKYGHAMYSVSYNILKNSQDAEECVNDAYLGIWKAIPPTVPTSLYSFVCRITRNKSLDRYRAKLAEKRQNGGEVSLEEVADCLPSERTLDSELDARRLSELFNQWLATQSRTNRYIFVRRYWYMNSVKEISSALRIGESKTKSMLMRTREKLKAALIKEGFEL